MRKYILLLVMALVLSGCAFTRDEIHISYHKGKNFTMRLQGAEKVRVEVKHEDKLTSCKDRVSTKKNTYGMEMAKIVSTNDIAETFANAIASELEELGFKLNAGDKTVKIQILRFYNDFKPGFFSGDAVAEGLIKIIVLNNKGAILSTHIYESTAIEPNIQIMTGSNARTALIKVMSDIVAKVSIDEDLQASLLKK